MQKLEKWEKELPFAVRDDVQDPLLCALGDTIQRRGLSLSPFTNLLQAFKLDLVKTRYKNWLELRNYTRYSADPVGRIILQFFKQNNEEFYPYSDNICTALQLANHWQDISEDYARGRIYIPLEDMENFSVSEDDIASGNLTDNFKNLMSFEIDRARNLFQRGKPLLKMVKRTLAMQLELYYSGGIAALDAIERAGYDVFQKNVKVEKLTKIRIGLKAITRMFI